MSVSMGMRNKATGEHRDVPIASLRGFTEDWLPLCRKLNLVWVAEFAGGALATVPDELIPIIIQELQMLAAEVELDRDREWIAARIRNVLTAFAETSPTEWEYDFG